MARPSNAPYAIVATVPARHRDAANAALEAAGLGPGTFSVPLTTEEGDRAQVTDYGCSARLAAWELRLLEQALRAFDDSRLDCGVEPDRGGDERVVSELPEREGLVRQRMTWPEALADRGARVLVQEGER